MNKLFAIGIPTINRADLLNPSLEKYVVDFPDTPILILDNGHQVLVKHPNILPIRPSKNMGVAGSWNLLCQAIFYEYASAEAKPLPYAFILNDDIYSGLKQAELASFLEANPAEDFFAPFGEWSNFIISDRTFDVLTGIGHFDQRFYPAYYEDNDYHYRMKLARTRVMRTDFLKPAVFRRSQSREKDPTLNDGARANLEYYIRKWGGHPDEERFRIPFDGDNL